MSKIEELLKDEKVEWKKLGEVANCFAGGTPNTRISSYYDGDIPWIRSGEINFNIITKSERNITEEGLKNSSAKLIRPYSVVLAMTGATVGRSGVVEFSTSCNQSIAAIETNEDVLNYKYLYHYISSKYEAVKNLGQGALTSLNLSIIKNIEIPIPPIQTQKEIAETLDKFTNYVIELQAELQARTKQYEYYRDILLSEEYLDMLLTKPEFEGEGIYKTEWKALGEIGSFQNGTGMPKSLFVEDDGIGAIHYGHIYTKYNLLVDKPIVKVSEQKASNLKKVFPGDLVIAKTSENIEDVMKTVAYVGYDNAVTGGHAAIFRHNENSKYLSYVFNGSSYLLRQKNKLARGVKVIELSITDMEKIKIPIPTVKIQEHIVSILDKFYTLLHNSSDGLQKEIELRQKQYEYYREKLLDFKK